MPGNDKTPKTTPEVAAMPPAEEFLEKSSRPVGASGSGQTGVSRKEKTSYIIAIGIDTYNVPGLQNFNNNCKKDCEDLIQLLQCKYKNFKVYRESEAVPEGLFNENASRDRILGRIESFINDPSVNNSNSNLIVFYSGHGEVVKRGNGETGCWIPYECKNSKEYNYVVPSTILYEKFTGLNTAHFLFISDSCYSGLILKDYIKDVIKSNKVDGEEFSCFAIVSSRSDEKSKAGLPNENSAFTKILLKGLASLQENRLLVSQLIGSIKAEFYNDPKQVPAVGRLVINNTELSGEFVFYGKEDVIEKQKRRRYLASELRTLNYKTQKEKFFAFQEVDYKSLIAVFDGVPEHGVRHMAWLAKTNEDFPAKNQEIFLVQLPTSLSAADASLFSLLSGAFSPDIKDMQALKERIKLLLDKKHVVFEIRFYKEEATQNSGEQLRDTDKQKIVQQVAEFMSEISQNLISDFKLFLFVIDEGNSNYMTKFNSGKIANVETIYFPPAESLDAKTGTIWYDEAAARSGNKDEFNELFLKSIRAKMKSIIDETKGYPGNVIRKICNQGECIDLAEEILNPK